MYSLKILSILLLLDNCDSLPSALGPKYFIFKVYVIAHIVATTLLPQLGSLSTLSQRDTLLTFCIATQRKIYLSSFFLNYMIETSLDPSSLSYGLIITQILEACDVPLSVFPSISVK